MDNTVIGFTKVALPYGWLGNMSPFPIEYDGKTWRTSEALFQALRFDDDSIREIIREQKSPMAAKMMAKKYRENMKIQPLSDEDFSNMVKCVTLKVKQHPMLAKELLLTGNSILIEDVSSRGPRGSNLYWGSLKSGNEWIGENKLGQIWMHIRLHLKQNII